MNIKKNILRLGILPLLGGLTWSCSNALPSSDDDSAQTNEALVSAPIVALSEEDGNPLMSTRATYFNGEDLRVYFTWEKGQIIGITPIVAEAQQIKYECKSVSETAEEATDGISRALFKPEDAEFAWTVGQTYRAYFPYTPAIDMTAIPLDYSGQQQTGKPDMESYYKGGDNLQTYYESEKLASAHLTAKSYMISAETTAEANKNLPLKMSYLCGIVRFFLTMPIAEITVSEVRLVATKAVFCENATLNLQTGSVTPVEPLTNNVVLTFANTTVQGDVDVEGSNRLAAYMMVHPVELTNDDVLGNNGKLYIYVKGEIDGDEVYYRSGAIKKKDIVAGDLTQFSVSPKDNNDPIDVQPITLQEWQEGLTLTNGEEGTGTGNW